jgi:hypothetical protein
MANKKQKNNHARAKRRVKVLKLKMFIRHMWTRRAEKIAAAHKPKGTTVTVNEKKEVLTGRIERIKWDERQNGNMKHMNQRQKRKLWRQAPQMRRKAA